MRKLLCAANWKMNKTPKEAALFFSDFLAKLEAAEQEHFLFFPPAIDLTVAQEHLQKTQIGWGAQNCYFEKSGAFTGENSPEVISQMGATHVLVGHSERRSLFSENDEFLAQKVQAFQEMGLVPLFCVGEQLAERESGDTNAVLTEQLERGLGLADLNQPIVIAYEPVWAIGTGKVATPEQAEETHAHVRSVLAKMVSESRAEEIQILYGGSVKPENAQLLGSQANIDGFLVGGASLQPQNFYDIFQQARH